MIGATVLTPLLIAPDVVLMLPMVVGMLAACVAYARWRVAPLRARRDQR